MNTKLMVRSLGTRHGFTLMEMMAVLPVMAVFLLMAGQLFVACLHTLGGTDKLAAELSQRRGLLRELRQDVATAASVQIQGSHGLICRYGKKRVILWLMNADGTVTCLRQNGNISPRPEYWPALLTKLHFAPASNGCVDVCWQNGSRHVTETLDSPMSLADAGKTGEP